MNSYILLGIIGSVSSIISLMLAAPNMKSRLIHALYGFFLTIIVGSAFIFNQSTQDELARAKAKIEQMESLRVGAKNVAQNYYDSPDVGRNRGFILSAFAFLEKNQDSFPESYLIAKKLVIDGLLITKSAGDTEDQIDERKRMEDGAKTMKALLNGIASG